MLYSIFIFLNINDLNNLKLVNNKYIDKMYAKLFYVLKAYRKCLFFNLNVSSSSYWIYKSVNSVTTIEECEFVADHYYLRYDKKQFISYIHYNLSDFNQVQLETWMQWMKIKKK